MGEAIRAVIGTRSSYRSMAPARAVQREAPGGEAGGVRPVHPIRPLIQLPHRTGCEAQRHGQQHDRAGVHPEEGRDGTGHRFRPQLSQRPRPRIDRDLRRAVADLPAGAAPPLAADALAGHGDRRRVHPVPGRRGTGRRRGGGGPRLPRCALDLQAEPGRAGGSPAGSGAPVGPGASGGSRATRGGLIGWCGGTRLAPRCRTA